MASRRSAAFSSGTSSGNCLSGAVPSPGDQGSPPPAAQAVPRRGLAARAIAEKTAQGGQLVWISRYLIDKGG